MGSSLWGLPLVVEPDLLPAFCTGNGGHPEAPEHDLPQHDCDNGRLLDVLHAVRVEGAGKPLLKGTLSACTRGSSSDKRFPAMTQPRNMLLFACHVSNCAVQLYNLNRWGAVQDWSQGVGHVIQQALPKGKANPAPSVAASGVVAK